MVKILDIVGFILCFAAAVFALVAAAIPYWKTGEEEDEYYGTVELNFGLWRYCYDFEDLESDICGNILDITEDDTIPDLKATRGLVLVGLILTTAAVVPALLLFVSEKHQNIKRLTAAILTGVGGLFLMIGMAVFVHNVFNEETVYHVAFAMDIVAWLLSWIAMVILLIMSCSPNSDVKPFSNDADEKY